MIDFRTVWIDMHDKPLRLPLCIDNFIAYRHSAVKIEWHSATRVLIPATEKIMIRTDKRILCRVVLILNTVIPVCLTVCLRGSVLRQRILIVNGWHSKVFAPAIGIDQIGIYRVVDIEGQVGGIAGVKEVDRLILVLIKNIKAITVDSSIICSTAISGLPCKTFKTIQFQKIFRCNAIISGQNRFAVKLELFATIGYRSSLPRQNFDIIIHGL